MSVLLDQPETPMDSVPEKNALPDASVLEDKTPEWFRSRPFSVVMTTLLGCYFVVSAARPCWHTDLWDHINYGDFLLQQRAVFSTEPLLPLCKGMPMVDIPWAAQAGMAALLKQFGLSAIQFAVALLTTVSLGLVTWRASARAGSGIAALLALFLYLMTAHGQLSPVRPQVVGVALYGIVIAWAFARNRFGKASWIGLPLIFAIWANTHGSFAVGLIVAGLSVAGRFWDVVARSRSLRIALLDRQFLQGILLFQLCGAAVLLNPYGLAVYPEVFTVAGNPNVETMIEWEPLTLRNPKGMFALATLLLTLAGMKLTPRRTRGLEYLSLVVLGIAALWTTRMLIWWAPAAAIIGGTHWVAVFRNRIAWIKRRPIAVPTGLWTVVNVLMIGVFMMLTNLGVQVLHHKVRAEDDLVVRETPVQVAHYLAEQNTIPSGIVFMPSDWAGYMMYKVPGMTSPMVTLHVHVIPPEVWEDYLRVYHGPGDWAALLDKYGINMAVVDKIRQPQLLGRLRESGDWEIEYHDAQAAVFRRRQPI
ncbi:MAG: hypothetical protein KDA96_14170 [Planctomycetaceae bacterium]|nr:hypothetical protein [Planctomycetaceae bacterium]